MSTKDFAETRTIADDVAFLRDSMKSTRDGSFCSTEYSQAALERVFAAALRVPSPPSEDLPDTCALADVAALQGLLASGADDTWTISQNVQKALDYSDALIKARKAREVKA